MVTTDCRNNGEYFKVLPISVKMKKPGIFAVFSTKGGVGKTTVAANLATSLRMLGLNVLAIDAHFFAPDLGLHFGILKPLKALENVGRAAREFETALIRHVSTGVYLLLCSGTREVEWKYLGRILKKASKLFDAVVVDMPPWPGIPLKAAKKKELGIKWLLITTQELPAVIELRRTLELFKGREEKYIVLNRFRPGKELKPVEIEELLKHPVDFLLRESKNMEKANELGVPVVFFDRTDGFSRDVMDMARKLLGVSTSSVGRTRGFLKFLRKVFFFLRAR